VKLGVGDGGAEEEGFGESEVAEAGDGGGRLLLESGGGEGREGELEKVAAIHWQEDRWFEGKCHGDWHESRWMDEPRMSGMFFLAQRAQKCTEKRAAYAYHSQT
jgi:hypothetical protein